MTPRLPAVRITLQPRADRRPQAPLQLHVTVRMGEPAPPTTVPQELAAERLARDWLQERMACWSQEPRTAAPGDVKPARPPSH